MHYASLASGSKGNCHALSDGERVLLVDAGISFLQIRKRLALLDWDVERVAGLALTHEHSDHIAALPVILKKTSWPLLATEATLGAVEKILGLTVPRTRWIPLRPGRTISWDGWGVLPFSTPHDAVDPVGFRVEVAGRSIAVVTDLGHGTALVVDHCRDLDLLALESNHDVDMLRDGSYPPLLKARILSRVGHLSNDASGELLARVLSPRLKAVVLAHLSEQNNVPELARFAATQAVGNHGVNIIVATQREPLLIGA